MQMENKPNQIINKLTKPKETKNEKETEKKTTKLNFDIAMKYGLWTVDCMGFPWYIQYNNRLDTSWHGTCGVKKKIIHNHNNLL